jgi:uncharacterized protein YbbC (DUF1343 family)
VGRGTGKPFEIAGYPDFVGGDLVYTPKEIAGVIKDPPYEGIACRFIDYGAKSNLILTQKKLMVDWLINMYESFPDKDKFFIKFFDTLAGTDKLRNQIINHVSEVAIRKSWQEDLDQYKTKRSNYMLYAD